MAFTSKSDKVTMEMAVLRYRAVIGTASMNKATLTEGVKEALQCALHSYKAQLEKAGLYLVEKEKEKEGFGPVSFVGNNHYICGWPMLTFDIRLVKKKRLINNHVTIRVYVAADMLRNSQVKSDTMQYCRENNIIIIDNLFQFCQPPEASEGDHAHPEGGDVFAPEWRRKNAENEILDQIHSHIRNNQNNNNHYSNNNSNSKVRHNSAPSTSPNMGTPSLRESSNNSKSAILKKKSTGCTPNHSML